MKGSINGIRQYGNDLYIYGSLSIPKPDGDTIRGLARWDGTEWRGVEGVTGISQIGDFAFDPFGSLYIHGSLSLNGEMIYGVTAKWNGTEWTIVPPVSKQVMKIEVIGTALYIEGQDGIYRYDGASWTEITAEMPEGYQTHNAELLAADDYGNLYVSVRPTAPDYYGDVSLFRWNGVQWQQVPGTFTATPAAYLYDIVFDGKGGFSVCGQFDAIGDSLIANNVGLWDGAKWIAPESGIQGQEGLIGEVASVLLNNGYLYVGGETLQSLQTPGPHGILRWSESKGWEEAGGGIDGNVRKIARDSAGNLYAAGCFRKAGNAPARNVARWDGRLWHPVGEGPDFCVTDIAVSGDTIYAVGGTALAQWNGTGWERLADIGKGELRTVAAAADGTVYVGGTFDSAGGLSMNGVARWRRGEWAALDGGMKIRYPLYVFNAGGPVEIHALLADGPYLYAAGMFDSAGMTPALNIARWDGTVWEALDSGLIGEYPSPLYNISARARVYGLMIHEGSLYATGRFFGAGSWGYKSPRRYNLGGGLARWDAANKIWTAFFDLKEPDDFYSMLLSPRTLAADGKWLYVGGDFLIAGSQRASYRIGRTTFPSSAVIEPPIVGNDFYCGTSPVRRSTERTLHIVNPAGSNRTLVGRVEFIDGPFAPPYDPEFRIAPGDTVEFPIRFSPTVPGTATGLALIRHNATTDSTPIPIRLSGIGIPLDVNFTVEPAGIDFGEVVQSPYLTEIDTLFIRNHASSNSTISFRLEAASAAPLIFHWRYRTIMEDAAETNTLIPGEDRSFLIEMKPEHVGDFHGTIVLSHDGEPGGEVRIPLHVTVVPAFARLNFSSDRIDFGEVPIGSTRFDTITIVADPRSNQPVYLGYSLVPELLPPFTVTKYGRPELEPAQSTTMILAFTPTSADRVGDTLLLIQHINFVIDTLRIPVFGRGGRPIITAPHIQLSHASLDFGSVARNGQKELALTVTNPPAATAPLIISTTPPSPPFSAQRQRDLSLLPGRSTDLHIRFAPTAAGTFTDQLLITHNVDGTPTPLAVPLRGESRTSSVDAAERREGSALLIAEPNPAAGRTHIRFRAAAAGTARLSIYTTDGREVARLIDGKIEAGERSIEWETASVGSGIYLCWLTLGEQEESCLLIVR